MLSTETAFKIYDLEQRRTKPFLSGQKHADIFGATKDINVSVNDALDETQVRNKINMSYGMKYFGKQEKQLIAADKPICKYI